MSRTLFILFCAIGLASSGLAAPADELKAVEARIQEAWSRHKSVTARVHREFHHARPDDVSDARGDGTVEVLRKRDRYLQRSEASSKLTRTTPDNKVALELKVTIIQDGAVEYLTREGNGQTFYVKMRFNPGMSVVPQTAIEFLAQSAELKALPEQTIDGQKVWVIEGRRSKLDRRSGVLRTVLYFLQDSGALRRKEGYDAANVKVETTDYTDFQFDQNLDPQRFVFKAPPGATVIDRTKPQTATTQPGARRSPVVGRLPRLRPAESAPASQPQEPPRP